MLLRFVLFFLKLGHDAVLHLSSCSWITRYHSSEEGVDIGYKSRLRSWSIRGKKS